jgi:hypothetical protein
MRFDSHHWVLALAVTALMAAPASGDYKAVELREVPAAVRHAAEKAAPACTWTKAAGLAKSSPASAVRAREKKYSAYRLSGKTREGRETEAVVTARGDVLEIRTEIPMDEVPQTVADAYKGQSKDFKSAEVESIATRGQIAWYEFKGKNSLGKAAVILVSANGETAMQWDEDNANTSPGQSRKP